VVIILEEELEEEDIIIQIKQYLEVMEEVEL
jgi:hypothetical protein